MSTEENQIVNSKSIAADDDDDDIQNWVNKTRMIEKINTHKKKITTKISQEARKIKISKRERELADKRKNFFDDFESEVAATPLHSRYTEDDLKGLKIAHDFQDLKEGELHIMTLKDSEIISKDGEDVNQDDDQLENINLTEEAKTRRNLELKKKKPIYDVEKELLGEKQSLLAQYDDEAPAPAFYIGGKEPVSTMSALESIRSKLSKKSEPATDSPAPIKKMEYTLNTTTHIAADQYTKEEMTQFRKASGKTKKTIRKKKKEEPEENIAEMLLAQQEREEAASAKSDHGKRGQSTKLSNEQKADKAQAQVRMNAYKNAVKKAQDEATAVLTAKSAEPGLVKVKLEDEGLVSVKKEDEDPFSDDEMGQELRNLERRQIKLESTGVKIKNEFETAQEIVEASEKRRLREEEQTGTSNLLLVNNNPSEVAGGNLLTTTTEFCRSIAPAQVGIASRIKELKSEESKLKKGDSEEEEEDDADLSRVIKKGMVEKQKTAKVARQEAGSDSKAEDKKSLKRKHEEESVSEMLNDVPLYSGGMAATLKALQQRKLGSLDSISGRPGEETFADLGEEAFLCYRDEYGRVMTPKEAFRDMSHRFHGRTNGKAKTEKRVRQHMEEMRVKSMKSDDTPLGIMEALKKKQEQTQSPFVVLGTNHLTTVVSPDIVPEELLKDVNKDAKKRKQNYKVEKPRQIKEQKRSFYTSNH